MRDAYEEIMREIKKLDRRSWDALKPEEGDYSVDPLEPKRRNRHGIARGAGVAARCKECGVVTWHFSQSGGRTRANEEHAEGCSKPPGKFDRAAKE
jgi:hypothetical protein